MLRMAIKSVLYITLGMNELERNEWFMPFRDLASPQFF